MFDFQLVINYFYFLFGITESITTFVQDKTIKNKIMAYISTSEVKVIRDELKSLFQSKKGWKLSISREHSSCLNVKILAAPVELRKDTSKENESVSEYHLEDRNVLAADLLKMLFEICDRTNFNHSDYSTDYFHVGYYTRVEIGAWDKPFILNNN